MTIKNFYSGEKVVNLEKRILRLLKFVPPKEIAGLSSIVLVDKIFPEKHNILGRYHVGNNFQSPRIELAIESIFNDLPKLVCRVPIISNSFIAKILYHEIGHHFQTITTDINKRKWEKFASDYSIKQMQKTFFWLRVVIKPMRAVRKTFNRESYKQQ